MSSNQIFEIYCAGKFISTSVKHSVANPYDGSEVATTFLAGDDELDQAIKAAQNITEELRNIPSYISKIRRIENRCKNNKNSAVCTQGYRCTILGNMLKIFECLYHFT